MKLLVISPFYKPAYRFGGPIRSLSILCQGLAELGVSVRVLTTNANAGERLQLPLCQPIDVDGVEVYYYPLFKYPLGTFYFSPKMGQAIKKYVSVSDAVWLDTLWEYPALPAAAACWKYNIPYIIAIRGQLLPWSLQNSAFKKELHLTVIGRRILNRASALFCTASIEAESLKSLELKSPTFVVPNGIHTNKFANLPVRGNLRQRFLIPENAIVLLLSGRLHPKKRPDIAITTLARLQKLPIPAHLLIVGDDESKMLPGLQEQARSLGCENNLHYAGLLNGDDILSAYADCDLLLMPSEPQSENFGMSAAEAMASGMPILTTAGIPVGEWAAQSGSGETSDYDPSAFADAAFQLTSNRSLLQIMGQRGKLFAVQHFDYHKIAVQVVNKYEQIISAR